MKIITHSQMLEKHIGGINTQKRKQFDNEISLYKFGQHVKKLRINRNLTKKELGKQIGKSKTAISKIEKGEGNIDVYILIGLAKSLNIDISLNISIEGEDYLIKS